MRVSTLLMVLVAVGGLVVSANRSDAALSDHAAAGTNSFDVYDSDDKFTGSGSQGGGVWEIGNIGPYAASIARNGTSTKQTFSGSANVNGTNSDGVLKASSQVNDTGSGWKVGVNSKAVWQDTIYVDNASVNDGDDLTVVVGASASLSADSDNTQQTQTRVIVGGGEPSFSINGSFPGNSGTVIADAEERPFSPNDGWDGNLLPHWAATAGDAGWQSFTSSVTRDSEAESFTASFDGTTAFDVNHQGLDNGSHVYEFKVVLEAYSYTEEGSVITNAGSSLDILEFRDASGAAIDPSLYSFESGMTMVPEPASAALLGLGALMAMPRRRRGI